MNLRRETIVHEALLLLNEAGIDGVTTRKLAERLGVKSASLYWHFKDKRDLLDAMAEAMLPPREPPLGDWRDWLAQQARGFRKDLLANRDGARVHVGTRPQSEDYPLDEEEVRFLCDAGFTPTNAIRVLITTSYFVVGWVLEEQAAGDAFRANGEKTPAPSAETFPLLAKGQTVLRQQDSNADFEYGLQALIVGFGTMMQKV